MKTNDDYEREGPQAVMKFACNGCKYHRAIASTNVGVMYYCAHEEPVKNPHLVSMNGGSAVIGMKNDTPKWCPLMPTKEQEKG